MLRTKAPLAEGTKHLYCYVWFTSNLPEAQILAMEFGENCTVEKYPEGGPTAYHTHFEIDTPSGAQCEPCWDTVKAQVTDGVLLENLCMKWVGGHWPG